MSELPPINLEPTSVAEQALLEAWLTEFYADLALRSVDIVEDSGSGRVLDTSGVITQWPDEVGPGDAEPEPGAIRLMHPTVPGMGSRLYYLAVLRREASRGWLCTPFSPYSTPASPGEVASGIDEPGLRVISLWNARTISDEVIAQSWPSGRLPDELRSRCEALLEDPPHSWLLAARRWETQGPRVVHSLDPRHDYMAEELATAVGLNRDGSEGGEEGESHGRMIEYPDASSDQLLVAAEKGVPYGMVATYAVEDGPLVINFWMGSRTMLLVRVVDQDDRPSSALDGHRLIGPRDIVSPRISTGCLTVPRAYMRDDLRLQAPDESTLDLRRLA